MTMNGNRRKRLFATTSCPLRAEPATMMNGTQKKTAVCNHIMSFTCRASHYDEREQKKTAVCNHIMSFTCRASHYDERDTEENGCLQPHYVLYYARRGEKNRKYLPRDLRITKMKQLFDKQNHTHTRSTTVRFSMTSILGLALKICST